MSTHQRFAVADLHRFTNQVFEATGIPKEHAADATDVLLYANRRGVDTHGVRNLKSHYCRHLASGDYPREPNFQIVHETPVSARVDGGGGLGLAGASWAMRLAIQKAEQVGMAMVSMRNSYHYGAAGRYPWMALEHDMIGISMTGRFSPAGEWVVVKPTFAGIPMFSTNPIAIGFPTDKEPPYVLDMATSTVPFNRITMMAAAGQSIPLGWGTDVEGNPITDPALVKQLHPLGGSREQGSHKGYGLSMMVEVMCALLSGAWDDGHPEDDRLAFDGYRQSTDGHFFAAIKVDAFRPLDEFKKGMDAMIQAIHAAPKEKGQERIYVAGEIEHETELERQADGIPLPDTVIADLQELSEQYNVPMPEPVG
ncbi:MAG: Ldh family oxidoreductase [Chloroflexota bacterium]